MSLSSLDSMQKIEKWFIVWKDKNQNILDDIIFNEKLTVRNILKDIPCDFDYQILSENQKKNYKNCWNILLFRHYIELNNTTLRNWSFCKNFKLCPNCAKRRAYIQRKDFCSYIDQNKYLLNYHWYYIVLPVYHNLTMSALDTLLKTKAWLNNARKFMKTYKNWWKKHNFFWLLKGSIYSFEVTHWRNWYNVHINLIWYTEKKIDIIQKWYTGFNQELSDAWLKATGDSYIVSIQELDFSTNDKIKHNIMEVFKYCLKNLVMPNDKLIEFYQQSKWFRFVWWLGELYWKKDLKFENDNLADDTYKKDEDYIDIVSRYDKIKKQYTRTLL